MTIDVSGLVESTLETLYLLIVPGIFITIIGLLVGYLLFFTESTLDKKPSLTIRIVHKLTSFIVDLARSIPFIILMIILVPVTIFLVGTMLGAQAAIPALIISAAPFYARLVYMSLRDVDSGKLEALEAMGANNKTKIKILTKEALPSLVSGLTVTLVTLVGFIASAGAIGAGGLGDLAIKKSESANYVDMYISVALVLVIVFVIQFVGDTISKKIDKR